MDKRAALALSCVSQKHFVKKRTETDWGIFFKTGICCISCSAVCTSSFKSLKEFTVSILIFLWSHLVLQLTGLVGSVFANGPGDLGSIPGRVIPKTLKMVLDTSLLNTQQYKVRIEGKVKQSRERSSALPYTFV